MNQPLELESINKDWTLFLDRDGVINHDKVGSYIFDAEEFLFYDGVPEAMQIFNQVFGKIIIVTNQRGVGKGLMSEADLAAIHAKMKNEVEAAGGRIDAIYHATSLDNAHPWRKPQTGMALEARLQFPQIDFNKSLMVGNNLSDMEFARNAGMYSVFLTTTMPVVELPNPRIDLSYNSLLNFARKLPVK